MTDFSAKVSFEIEDDIAVPRPNGGRTIIDDSELVVLACEGRKRKVFRSRNHAAMELASRVANHSFEATVRRLNRKFKDAGIE